MHLRTHVHASVDAMHYTNYTLTFMISLDCMNINFDSLSSHKSEDPALREERPHILFSHYRLLRSGLRGWCHNIVIRT